MALVDFAGLNDALPPHGRLLGLDVGTTNTVVETIPVANIPGGVAVSGDRLVAHCRLGKGKATIVADADLLNVDPGDRDSRHNLDALLVELANLE